MIHGSGPGIVGQDNLWAWVKFTNKPFGVFGTTIANVNDHLRDLLKKALFIYTRETKSLEVLKQQGVTEPMVGFAPDATFFLNIHNDQLADRFLKAHSLKTGEYICVIPRLRYTPYHRIRRDHNWSQEKIAQVESTNQQHKEADHAKLRAAMITWIRETGHRVLVCPEMTYQVNIMDELLINPLPDEVRPSVFKRGYWLPDETASVYRHAFAVLSFECHSPIIALANGTPAFYLRQPEDTIKGQMYYDLELPDWVFEIEQTEGQDIATALMTIWENPQLAEQRVEQVQSQIESIYRSCCEPINDMLLT
jgi:polysaccharide pyruvyl transferase WcaK-like protein